MTTPKRPAKVHADVASDKETVKTRIGRFLTVQAVAPQSPIFGAQPVVREAHGKFMGAGADLQSAEVTFNLAESAYISARQVLATKTFAFDKEYGFYVASAENHCFLPEDLTSLGLVLLSRSSYALAPPLSIEAKWDSTAKLIRIRVTPAPGMTACITEVSTDPENPDAWRRLPGVGALQTLADYAPGTYSFRAASARANDESDYTTSAPVVVK